MNQSDQKQGKIFKGLVISAKGNKTLIVKVDRNKINYKYSKKFIVSKKYKVHDEKNQYKEGETVYFLGCRPLSKEKRWRVIYS